MLIHLPKEEKDVFRVAMDQNNIYVQYSSYEAENILIFDRSKYYGYFEFIKKIINFFEKHPTIYEYINLIYASRMMMHVEMLLGDHIKDRLFVVRENGKDPTSKELFILRPLGRRNIVVADVSGEYPKFNFHCISSDNIEKILMDENKKVLHVKPMSILDLTAMYGRNFEKYIEPIIFGVINF